MANPVIKPGTVPADTQMPDGVQKLINLAAAYLQLDGLADLDGIIIGDTEPAAVDRDKAWIKLDAGSGRAIGLYRYSGGWQQVPVIVGSGEAEPAGAKEGELFYNTKLGTFVIFRDGAWTNELWARGTTDDRPEEPVEGYLYFDTTISRLLRYTSQGWSTVDGAVGELRMFADITPTEAETRNPGWTLYTAMASRFPMGFEEGEVDAGSTGGRASFPVSANIGKNNSLGGEGAVIKLNVDGNTIGGSDVRDNYATIPKELEADVDIVPPYKAVIFLRKQF